LAEGVRAPPRFASYAGLCAVSAHGAPIASQMHYDFKGMPTRSAMPSSSGRILRALAFSWRRSAARAQAPAPLGLWQTINERGQPEALVRITEVRWRAARAYRDVYSPPAPAASPLCELCPGELKGKPVVGMQICARSTARARSSIRTKVGSTSCTPHACSRAAPQARSARYVGISLFGRSQVWVRAR